MWHRKAIQSLTKYYFTGPRFLMLQCEKTQSWTHPVSTSNLSTFLLFRLCSCCCCWRSLVQLLLSFFCSCQSKTYGAQKRQQQTMWYFSGRASARKKNIYIYPEYSLHTLNPYPLYFHCLLQLYNIICWHYHDKGNLKVSRNLNWI